MTNEPFRQIMREIERDLALLRKTAEQVFPISHDWGPLENAISSPLIAPSTRFAWIKRIWARSLRLVTRRQDQINTEIYHTLRSLEERLEKLEHVVQKL